MSISCNYSISASGGALSSTAGLRGASDSLASSASTMAPNSSSGFSGSPQQSQQQQSQKQYAYSTLTNQNLTATPYVSSFSPEQRRYVQTPMSSLNPKSNYIPQSSSHQQQQAHLIDQYSENSTCCGSEEDNPEDFLDVVSTSQFSLKTPSMSQQSSTSSSSSQNSHAHISNAHHNNSQATSIFSGQLAANKKQPIMNGIQTGLVVPVVQQGIMQPQMSQQSQGQSLQLAQQQQQSQQLQQQQQSQKPTILLEEAKYKTEMCKNWVETNKCNYGEKCKFAHGKHELVQKVAANKLFKTKNCKQFFEIGTCNYGPRCHFLHDTREVADITANLFYQKRIMNPSAYFDSVKLPRKNAQRLPCFLSFSNN